MPKNATKGLAALDDRSSYFFFILFESLFSPSHTMGGKDSYSKQLVKQKHLTFWRFLTPSGAVTWKSLDDATVPPAELASKPCHF